MEIIKSRQNNKIKNIIKLMNSAKERKQKNLFVVEGLRLCSELLQGEVNIKELFCTKKLYDNNSKLVKELCERSGSSYIVDESLLSIISDTENSQGIICVCSMLDKIYSIDKMDKGSFIVLENINDPKNLGAIFRTSLAFNIKNVIITQGSCDVYSPKVLRASMGALFKLKFMVTDCTDDLIKTFKQRGYKTYATVVYKPDKYIGNLKFNSKSAVFIGNEANGLKDSTINLCDESVTIPMNKESESLNAAVAASIIIWEMRR
jgi:TrmH family RNA methyltransferase